MRILLIEDDDGVANVVAAGMAEAGHELIHQADGQNGLHRAMAEKFDVMIFDRQLPGGVDGADLLNQMRNAHVTTPVLFLSGLGDLSDWMRGMASGGDDYIVKPFHFTELLSRVEALHKSASTDQPPSAMTKESEQPGG